MQKDDTNVKSIYTCYKKGIYCISIVMETGYRFALKDTQRPLTERERTGTEPRIYLNLRTGLNLFLLHGANLQAA